MTDEVLSAAAMALYERLISTTAMRVGEDGVLPDDPAVRELLAAGFAELRGEPAAQLTPVAPVEAFERVLTQLQAEFLDQHRQLLDAYTYLDGLQERFLDTQPTPDAAGLAEIIPDDGAFSDAVARLIVSAQNESMCWNIAFEPVEEASGPRRLPIRTVYDTAFLLREGGAAAMRRARSAGEELRIADDLPNSMLIVDSTAVVLPLGPSSTGALVVRSPLVVNAMREFFELIWQRSVPWIDRETADEILTPVQHQVLALMAVGHSDEEIASHLGVSVRTVRRHVAEVLERLGANTRFAAGIAAARAGLLDDANLPRLLPDEPHQ